MIPKYSSSKPNNSLVMLLISKIPITLFYEFLIGSNIEFSDDTLSVDDTPTCS